MLSYNKNEGEEETGPSVDSQDIEERIAARRNRIQARVEAQRRAELGEDLTDKPQEEELSKSRKQMEVSRQRITKLLRDGNEFLTNIRVAGDARENSRRTDDDETKRQRRERIENEAKAGLERFEEITKKWESALQKEIPQDLYEMLQQQKEACNNMIEEKNKLINDLQLELKTKDDQYVKDLKKQAEDIDLMIERMDEQVKTMTKTYREELTQIEKSFIAQRDDRLEQQGNRWEQVMQAIRDKQNDFLDARQKRVDDFDVQLQELRTQHAEEYNSLKIKLETDVQLLEQQLQMMKATYQLNLEKLEYNFQVLKKRDEENTITKSQQKRKITRLQDVLNNLKVKLMKQEKQFKAENEQLTEDYKRVTEQFRDLQKKSKHLLAADSKKFRDIWLMNEEELKRLAERLLHADRIIHEQQLGLTWGAPDLAFMDNVGPVFSEKEKARAVPASQIVQEVLAQADSGRGPPASERMDPDGKVDVKAMNPNLVKSVLELLCDESGFLIEAKLKKLLQPLDKDEQALMRLDAVFSALGVTTEDDINAIIPYFLHFTRDSSMQEMDSMATNVSFDKGPEDMLEDVAEETPEAGAEDGEKADAEETSLEDQPPAGLQPKPAERPVLIHPNEVLKGLRAFADEFHRPARERASRAGPHFTLAELEDRDDSEDALYWASYGALISAEGEQVWDALLDGLERYNETLTSRSNLITETDALRVQNAELRHLLQQYVGSKVNQELEIPPTRVMQLDNPM